MVPIVSPTFAENRNYQSFDEAGKPVRTELIALKNDGLTVRFTGGAGAQVKKFKLLMISRKLKVTLPFDLRWNPQT